MKLTVHTARATDRDDQHATYAAALELIDAGVEPTSAFREAAAQAGIPCGEEMGRFVRWARGKLLLQCESIRFRIVAKRTNKETRERSYLLRDTDSTSDGWDIPVGGAEFDALLAAGRIIRTSTEGSDMKSSDVKCGLL